MSTVKTEHVLVVPTEAFHQLGHFQGFSTEVDRYVDQLLVAENISYRPRDEMEEDPSFKQLIPYIVFRHTDDAGRQSLFRYRRGSGNGESRLRSKLSIGIGGHISSEDAEATESANPYAIGMRRELDEEVIIETTYEERCVGMINDDETEVGKVHLGVVHIFDVETQDVRPREPEIAEAGFLSLEQLRTETDDMESWSRICFEALFG
ncbi:MAG: phosphoesterase [Planctomycetales bacterium]|nr:phosphoesterase [Planctomycetales bacterium]